MHFLLDPQWATSSRQTLSNYIFYIQSVVQTALNQHSFFSRYCSQRTYKWRVLLSRIYFNVNKFWGASQESMDFPASGLFKVPRIKWFPVNTDFYFQSHDILSTCFLHGDFHDYRAAQTSVFECEAISHYILTVQMSWLYFNVLICISNYLKLLSEYDVWNHKKKVFFFLLFICCSSADYIISNI